MWFRDKHKFHVEVQTNYGDVTNNLWKCGIKNTERMFKDYTNHKYITGATYEEAEDNCIDKLIEILKKQILNDKDEKILSNIY